MRGKKREPTFSVLHFWGQKNRDSRCSAFIIHHSSFIIHHSPPSPTITLGPYTGDELSVDHIIPFAVAPQLDHVIANLELMPLRMNIGKRDKMGQRQLDLLLKLRQAGWRL
jgi:hypothetical protein